MSLPDPDVNYADYTISVDKDLLLARLREFHPEYDPEKSPPPPKKVPVPSATR